MVIATKYPWRTTQPITQPVQSTQWQMPGLGLIEQPTGATTQATTEKKYPWRGAAIGEVKPTDTLDAQTDAFNQHLQEFYHQDRGNQTYLDFLAKSYPESSRQLTPDFISAINQTQPEFLGTQADFLEAHPVDMSALEKVGLFTAQFTAKQLEILSKGLEYGFYPFTAVGMALWAGAQIPPDVVRGVTPEVEMPAFRWEEGKLIGEPVPVPEKFNIEDWLPGGEKYKEYQSLPLYKQLLYEAPAWALLAAFAPSATSLRATLATPAKVGGIPTRVAATVARGVLAPIAGYEAAINKLIQLPVTAVKSGTKKVLQTYIDKNARYIRLIATQRTYASLSAKERLLYKIFNLHSRYMTEQAATVLKAQHAARVGATPAAKQTAQSQIALLNAGLESSTQTMSNIVAFAQTGKDLTTTSLKGLIATGTPTEFVSGITGIVSGMAIPETVTGITPTITEAPTVARTEWETVTGEGIPIGKVEVSRFAIASEARQAEIKSLLAQPAKNLPEGVTKVALRKESESITKQLATVSKKQKAKAHIIASEKALVNKKGKITPQYRRLAESITGRRTMKEMTLEEGSAFIEALEKYPEKKWSAETGTWIPQSIPTTKAVVPENYFNLQFGEPTPIKYFTSQTYYATKLGAGPLVEPLEIAKQELDLVYPAWRGAIDTKINELNKVYKITVAERLAAIKANKPTRASAEMAQLLNRYEDLPPTLVDSLGMEKVKIFSWFRNLSRTMLNGQNQVREILGMPLIPHREAYLSHIASKTAEEVMIGTHPLPSDLAYWSKQVVGKKIFNPRAIQRQLKDDLLEYFSRDLGYVTKSMVNVALKEIYLSQPLKAFNAQLNALNKGLMPFDSLTQAELKKAALINPMPASTRKWLVDYVNVVIKGQQTELDASINRIITQTGIGGLFDKFLLPFGRSVGLKPATRISQFLGRSIIYATIGTKPRQIIRNLQQASQDLAMCGIIPTLKSFLPADKNLSRMLDQSLFLKSYAIIEEMPTSGMSKVGRKWMWAYGKSAVFNAKKSMKASYHSKLHYVTDRADAKYGWADPARTYTEPKGFLYDSEYKRLLKEAEFSSGAAQYQYNPIGMPEVFRHKTLAPLTRLQSWWMNHFFKFHREALGRFWNGYTGWDPNLKLNWSDRLNWFKYLIMGGAILTALGYNRSFGRDVLPHWSPPGAQFLIGAYNYVIADSDYEKEKAQKQMFYSLRAFVPGVIDYNFYKDIWTGEKPLSSLFFYSEDWPPDMPTWGIPALVAEVELGHRVKRINEDIGEWTSKLGTLIPAEDETDAYTYEMTDLASDIWAELRNVPEAYRTEEKGFSDIVLMYNEARTLWDEHYYSLPASERQEFIKQDNPLNIQIGAYLVLWGKLKATGWASGNSKTIALVEQLINQYNIPPDAVPSMGELKEKGEEKEEGEYPWRGAAGGEPTPSEGAGETTPSEGETTYPWRGAAGVSAGVVGGEVAHMGFPLEQLISKLGAKGEPDVSGKYTRPAEMPSFPEGLILSKDKEVKAPLEGLLGSFRKAESDDSKVEFLDEAVGLYGQLAVKDSLTTEELAKYNWDIRASDWARYGVLAHFVHWGNEFHKVFGWITERADPEQLKRVTANTPEFQEIVLNTLLPIYKTEMEGFPEKTWQALLKLAVERYGVDGLIGKVEEIGVPNQWNRIKQEIRNIK